MNKSIRKYILSIPSARMILSNFSFASAYMIRGMKDSDAPCGCKHKTHQAAKVISFTRDSCGCCSEGTKEPVNTNLLSAVKTELPLVMSGFTHAILNIHNDLLFSSKKDSLFISLVEHVPKDDIPILTSSLLI